MASRTLPAKIKQLIGVKMTSKFRDAVQIQEVPLPTLEADQVLVKNRFVGINASEVNVTAGRYDPNLKPPYPNGFEGHGYIVDAGKNCSDMVGKHVIYLQNGAFSEYLAIDHKRCVPVPRLDKNYVSLMVSGLTAAIGLDEKSDLKPGKTVLVTAAAGGTGQFAIQWAKNAGCHVIGTCSTDEKAKFLKDLGCDRAIIYTKEDVKDVLREEYPKGVDIVYESVGGKMFEAALTNLAEFGQIVLIGFIETYLTEGKQLKVDEEATAVNQRLPSILILKSAGISGFFLLRYQNKFPEYLGKLVTMYEQAKIKAIADQGKNSDKGPFVGLESICDAVDYLYTKKSLGKIVVELNPES